MERILILGCPGSGKSNLARTLGERLSLPVVHLDQLWWKPGWVESTREEFDAKLAAELEKERWIIDGNYNRTLPQRLALCDTVIYLDHPRLLCLWGVLKRVWCNHGRTRADMPEGCTERLDGEFIQYVWNFHRNHREATLRLVGESGKPSHMLCSRRACAKFISTIM